ncbi:peptidase domain-containing ABC transporter, partial [bacterium]|nr:peptidase domain-containing ABC transporter [bacterium]
GVSLLGISDAAETIGMRTISAKVSYQKLDEEVPFPCIVHWNQQHFVVVYEIKKNKVYVADPGHGILTYTKSEFLNSWLSTKHNGTDEGIVLMLEPAPDFYLKEDESKINKANFRFFIEYLRPHKKLIAQIFVSMATGTLLSLIFPFLTQSIVDFGINNQNIEFVYTILIAQVMLFIGQTAVEFIRSWIFLHIGSRINISIISDFLIKLMKLSVSFFDAKMIGDILQRIGDNQRVQNFLTSTTLSTLFSMLNLVIFGFVLALYSFPVFLIFMIGSIISTTWIFVFMKKRRELDYKRFGQLSVNQSRLIQLITGMQEIKLNGCEKQKRWEWETIQAQLFKVNMKALALNQYQEGGTLFINQFKNIMISFLSAKEVIDGNITLGMMMAIQYIIGQLNSPISQLISFFQAAQDAKISLERMGEIHDKDDEEDLNEEKLALLPEFKSLFINNVTFQYEGPHSDVVLKNLTMKIPEGKITAIVGSSGSGKTTLLKLLLKFYPPVSGEIRLGEIDIQHISNRAWREKCGVVMQDGFIFSDTIAKNIALSDNSIDRNRLMQAVRVSNIQEFVESLPLGYNTKIGSDGHGLSQGQRQRLLIARAVYKNPEYIFFDEATSALDANNEKTIMENLNEFFKSKTVVVIAHRLSTVKNADQIVVLDKGQIIEHGNHNELTDLKGSYYHLVKNQLELGN